MKLSYVTLALAAALSSSGLVACIADPSPGIPSSQSASAISYQSTSALPSCDASGDLQVAYVVETDSFVVCFEGEWHGLSGAPGKDGKNGAPGRPGPRGFRGFDGAPGEQGPQGIPGLPGAPGLDGKDGKDGQDGKPGANGHSALVDIVEEPAGPNCKAGGFAITAGIDLNDNQVLDEGEGKTVYVCHGVSAEPPPPPPCGSLYESCCDGYCSASDLVCDSGNTCVPAPPPPPPPSCGNLGEECCESGCYGSLSCDTSRNTCVNPECRALESNCDYNSDCCSGYCYWSAWNTMTGTCKVPE